MKFTKISLAAVVALGALSTSSFAGSLEESIKGVDVSGYVRYRYESKNDDTTADTKDAVSEFKSHIRFAAPVTDNVGVTVGATYKEVDGTSADRVETASTSDDDSYNVDHYFVTITPSSTKTTILAGKRVIGAPTTDDMKANGITVLNSDISNVTLAGVYLDNLMDDGDATAVNAVQGLGMKDLNLYAAAAIVNFAPVTAQVWYFHVPNVVDSMIFAEVAADVDAGGAKIGVKGQYISTTVDSSLNPIADDATFYGVELTGNMDMFGLKAGYTAQKADNGGLSLVSFEDFGAHIAAGEQAKYAADVSGFTGEWTTMFAGVSVAPMSGLTIAAEYIAMNEDVSDLDVSEICGTVSYKYNKNWKLKSFYSSMNTEPKAGGDVTSDFFRFEAKYSF